MQEPVEVDVNMTERMGGERARTHLGNCGVATAIEQKNFTSPRPCLLRLFSFLISKINNNCKNLYAGLFSFHKTKSVFLKKN